MEDFRGPGMPEEDDWAVDPGEAESEWKLFEESFKRNKELKGILWVSNNGKLQMWKSDRNGRERA